MKKYVFALFLLLIGMMLTACSDNDNNANNGDPDTIYNFVEPETDPATDAMAVKITAKTLVLDGNYTGDAKALVARTTNRAESPVDATTGQLDVSIENIFLHNDKIGTLTNDELAAMVMVLANDGAIILADPTVDKLDDLFISMRNVLSSYQEGGNNMLARYIVKMLNEDAINRLVLLTEDFDYSVFLDGNGNGDYMSLLIIRELDSYVAYDSDSDMGDYHFGLKADRAAEWINSKETVEDAAASRRAAAEAMAARAGGEAEQYVDKIAKSWDYSYDVGRQIKGPQGYSKYHNCTVTIRIWTAYSKEKNCDVYCVTQTITAYNQNLKCGPSDERTWYNGSDWAPWIALSKSDNLGDLRSDVYGPYMKKIYTSCILEEPDGQPVKLEKYAPQNSTSGGTNESNGFSFGLGASVSVESSGPKASVSMSMSWSHSVSRFNPDLSLTASPSIDGVVEWTYTGKDVDSHFSKTPFRNHYHDAATSIQTNTCTLEQAWVWTVAGAKSSTIAIQPIIQLQDDWLTYDRWWRHPAEAYPHYISDGNKVRYKKIVINTPPRFIQTWSMSVKTEAAGADITKIRSYLSEQLSQYFLTSSSFYTRKADHKKTYNADKTAEEYDEIGKFVFTSKDAFTNNSSVKDILREAGKIGGIPDDGSYTIVWRQTDAGINSDTEEFTFNMK